MTKCFIKSCKMSDRKHAEGVSFHKIPIKLRYQWLRAIQRPMQTLVNNQRICSLHFNDEDFECYGARKCLKPGIVPSKFLPTDSPSPLLSELTREWVPLSKGEENMILSTLSSPTESPTTKRDEGSSDIVTAWEWPVINQKR